MRNRRRPRHPELATYEAWVEQIRRTRRLKTSTISVYASEVARFLDWLGKTRLSQLGPVKIHELLLGHLNRRGRSRMIAALSDFFAFAFTQKVMEHDPLRMLKYRRSALADEAQLDFLALLKRQGLKDHEARGVLWADFVEPMLRREELGLRVKGRTVHLARPDWSRLEVEFRMRAYGESLESLLRKPIAV